MFVLSNQVRLGVSQRCPYFFHRSLGGLPKNGESNSI